MEEREGMKWKRGENNDSSGGNGIVYQSLSDNMDKRAESSDYREDERTF